MSDRDRQKAEIREWRSQRMKILPVFLTEVILGLALTFGIYYGGYYHCDSIPVPQSNDFMLKLQYTLRCCAFPFALSLFFTILQVGNKRGGTPAANPLAGKEQYVELEKKILNNTMEQTVLSFLLLMALTTYLQSSEMKFIPIYVLNFLVGRIVFIVGYKISPMYRSCGMWMCFGGNFFVFGLIGYLVYSNGLIADIATIVSNTQNDIGREEL